MSITDRCAMMPADEAGAHCGWAFSEHDLLLTASALLTLVCLGMSIGYGVWNWGYRQGTTGSSVGKSVLKYKVVSDTTWQPIGFGRSLKRLFAHFTGDVVSFVGILRPLWHPQRQTFADKAMGTVCVPIDTAAPPVDVDAQAVRVW